ncbi:unnamed protein product [Arctogadus glacialis]
MLAQVGQQRLAVFGALGGDGLLGVCWAVGEVDGSLSQGLMDEGNDVSHGLSFAAPVPASPPRSPLQHHADRSTALSR